jgi:hypothetical protein
MASSFPSGLDNFTNPSASDTLDSATVPHAAQHSNANDAIEAIESTLGVNPQGGSATVVARLTALDSTVAGKVVSVGAGDSTITVAGTSTSPTVKVNQANLTIAESQVTNLVSDLAGKAPASGISPSAITGTAVTQADTGTVTSAMIANGTIVSADISGSAAITNGQLANSSVSVNGLSVALGGSVTVTATPTDASVTDAKIATTLSPSKITGTAAVLGSANTFTVGGQTINNASASVVPLSVKGTSAQVADLQTWLDSNGATSGHISADGSLTVGEEATTNLIPNPSFEVSTAYTGSSRVSFARDSTYSAYGSYALKVTCDGTGSPSVYPNNSPSGRLPVTSGQNYTFSAYVRDGNTALPFKIVLEWYTSANVSLGSVSSISITPSSSQWTRMIFTATAPATAAFCTPLIQGQGTPSAGTIWYLDSLQLEAKNYATSYIDGSLPGGAWSGTAGLSTSSRIALSVDRADSGLVVGNNATFNALTQVNAQAPGNIMFTLKRALNHFADQVQFKLSTGTILAGFNAIAQFFTGSTSPVLTAVGGATTAASGDGTTATLTLTSASNLAVNDLITVAGVTPTGYNTTSATVTAVTNTSPFTVSYLNTTTGSQTVAGTVSVPPQASITARSAGTKGIVVKAAASQAANLVEVQNSSGTQVMAVSSSGAITSPSATLSGLSTGVVHADSSGALTSSTIVNADISTSGLDMSVINSGAITTWAASTSYTKGDLVSYSGVAYRRIATGTSGSTFDPANWNQITPSIDKTVNPDFQPTSGLDIFPRLMASGTRALANGTNSFMLFVSNSNISVSNITTLCTTGGTDTGGTIIRRMGLFTVNPTTNAFVLVARTASDSTLWNTSGTSYTKAFDTTGGYPSSYALVAGLTYAVGCIAYNTGGTFGSPTLAGTVTLNAALTTFSPAMFGQLTGQTDLNTGNTITTGTTTGLWARLT